jgi:hypothetical protein
MLGALLLDVALLGSAAAGWSLRRASRPSRRPEQHPGGARVAILLLVSAIAASGAAALSDGTWGIGGWSPFAAGSAAACLPVAGTGLRGWPSG